MDIYENELYLDDINFVANLDLPWEKIQGKTIIVSGATGLIGSFFLDVIMKKNMDDCLNCTICALGRNEEKARARFLPYTENPNYVFIRHDVTEPLVDEKLGKVDYILHLASNTHPMLYATDPIGTITTNVFGLQNLLDFAVVHSAKRFIFASSNEIYGENRGDTELFDEEYCGYINCNTMRAGYPESKRCGEALCQAYKAQKNLDVVIARFTRSYGPTMLASDTKAISQFIKKGIAGEDIILKSKGTQCFSYTYMADAVSGLMTLLFNGKNGEAYNIADQSSDITLRELAETIAGICSRKVIFEIPDKTEASGYSTATKARLSGEKLKDLGWKPRYDIASGIRRTIDILNNEKVD